jgi:hypothetical protein
MPSWTPEQLRDFEAHRNANQIPGREVAPAEPVEAEADLHDEIIAHCRSKGWAYAHNRMDKKSTAGNGVADFIIFADSGRVFAIECKSRSGKRTVAQMGFAMQLNKLGHKCWCIKSMEEFKEIVIDK